MNQENPINFSRMKPEKLERISELDRLEHVTLADKIEDGMLAILKTKPTTIRASNHAFTAPDNWSN